MVYPEPLERLVEELQRLPTVGPKTALRLAFHLLTAPPEEVEALASAMLEVQRKLRPCSRCGNLSDQELCGPCRDPRRDGSTLCVVATVRDLMAVERTREFRGLYHVLGGLISPLGATALYLHRLVAERPVRVTRLALGLPMGSDLEYADEVTLGRALSGRRQM